MKKWHLIIDVEKCENCGNCFLSCRDEHVENDWPGYAAPQADHGPGWINVSGRERGQYPLIDVAYLPLPCMHCESAPCIKAAGNGEIFRRPDGIVIIDPVKSKGRKNLANACPYGVIQWNEKQGLPQKCTLCAHLLDKGWDKSRCVQSCPTGALSMIHVENEEMTKIAEAERLEPYGGDLGTKPSVYYKNLYRYTKCFVGGSISTRATGPEECVEGAVVTLFNSGGSKVGETMTDAFGDFKFDGLEPNSGIHTIGVSHGGHESTTVKVDLKESVTVPTIVLE